MQLNLIIHMPGQTDISSSIYDLTNIRHYFLELLLFQTIGVLWAVDDLIETASIAQLHYDQRRASSLLHQQRGCGYRRWSLDTAVHVLRKQLGAHKNAACNSHTFN